MNSSGNALRVVLADDHHFFREGLRDMLESAGVSVVGEAKDGAEAVALARELGPDLIVLDLDMSDTPGAEALRQIATTSPQVRMVVLTTTLEEVDVLEVLDAGACGYILKSTPADELIDSIRQTAGSRVVLSREVVHALMRQAIPNDHAARQMRPSTGGLELTTREKDVLRLLVEGADNAAIGLQLSISRHTVKQHVTNIFEKLGVHSRVEAAVFAVRADLL
ncbi:MAG TPA: response regulator transcription factor [Solirubrobacteraceae bacterium]|nr:response regulator transcription factor [Solirubrobacteraceae bacterium]